MQPKLGEQAVRIGKIVPSPLLPISLNTIIIKIDPHGNEFAMIIQQAHGFGDVVAGGHHLRVQLRSQNCKFATPGKEKALTEHLNPMQR
jgi:hypothetical protein